MLKMYQEHWFDIDFRSFAKLSTERIADVTFYNTFYESFYERYDSWNDLPETYRINKRAVAETLLEQIGEAENVLSIGAGNGIVEQQLASNGIEILAIEPSRIATKWLVAVPDVKVLHGMFPDVLPRTLQIDFAYATAIDYVFDDGAYQQFLQSILEFGIETFVMHQITLQEPMKALNQLKYLVKRLLSHVGLYDLGQFWGYMRTLDEQRGHFTTAGFKNVSWGQTKRGHTWVMGTIR